LGKPGENAWLAVDTETDALGAMGSKLCGICLSAREGRAFYLAVKGAGGDVLDGEIVRQKVGPLLEDETIKKVGQNVKYEINSLRVFGIEMKGAWLDTMVASYVLDSSRLSHGMDALAADWLGLEPIPITDLIGKGAKQISFADVPLERACGYAAEDADVTLRLAGVMYPKLVEMKLDDLCFKVEMPLVEVLADMEFYGVSIDVAILQKMSGELADRLMGLSKKIREAAGVDFNHDSPKQLAEVLFKTLKLPVIKKTKTGPSTDIDVLEELADKHPVPALIVEYRQLTKLKNTYLDTLAKQVNPATGRLSSSDPNLQNIPIRTDLGREIRRAFVAKDADHVLITADYSQIELRVLAHYCQDAALVRAFAEDKDVHKVVAAEIFSVPESEVTAEQRAIAKTVNFGIIYGQTGFGLSKVLKIEQGKANDFIRAYKKRFAQIDKFTQECVKQASLFEYVTTILGRRRLIPDINSPIQARRAFGQRAAMNSVIQGSAADLIKLAMVTIHKKLKAYDSARLIMQIHDELVVECATKDVEAVAAMVKKEMEGAMELKVPLKVDMAWGRNWLEGE
jgi:DNA polymerase-1